MIEYTFRKGEYDKLIAILARENKELHDEISAMVTIKDSGDVALLESVEIYREIFDRLYDIMFDLVEIVPNSNDVWSDESTLLENIISDIAF